MFLGQKQVTNSSNLHVLQNYKHTHVKHTTQLMNAPCKTFFYTYYYTYSSRTKILSRVYLTNRLELDAHIFTQGKYGTLDVPFGGLVDFGLGGSIFGAKNYVFGNKSCTRRISGTAWI